MLVMLDIGGRRIVRKMQCQAGLFAGSELLKLETIINQLKIHFKKIKINKPTEEESQGKKKGTRNDSLATLIK